MSYDYDKFSDAGYRDFEIEALQEISNVGVGHAATALSQLLHRRVDMSVPSIEIVHFSKLGEKMAESLEAVVSSILVDSIDNGKMFNLLLIFDELSSKNILRILKTGEPPEDLSNLDEVSQSIILETGNILLLHTISAINQFAESQYFPKTPQMSIDMIGSILDEIISRQNIELKNESFLLIECNVFTESDNLKGHIVILPNESGIRFIMNKLYGEGIYDEEG
jgi:chemotaxis protein CheC